MIRIIALLTLILTGVLSACSIKMVEIGKIEGVNITNISKDKVEIELLVPVKNPNNFGFRIAKADIELWLNGKCMGQVKKTGRIRIPANSSETHAFKLEVKYDKIAESAGGMLLSVLKNKVDLKAKGKIKICKFIFCKKLEINEDHAVKLFNKGLL
jgi:LEA14-like dessication related protein